MADDPADKGLRYVESSMYMLVTTDNNGGLKTTFLTLPDRSRLRSARPWAFMSTNNTSFTFENGSVSTSATEIDTTKVPTALITAAGAVLALNKSGDGSTPTEEVPAKVPGPRLYKLLQDTNGAPMFVQSKEVPDIFFKP